MENTENICKNFMFRVFILLISIYSYMIYYIVSTNRQTISQPTFSIVPQVFGIYPKFHFQTWNENNCREMRIIHAYVIVCITSIFCPILDLKMKWALKRIVIIKNDQNRNTYYCEQQRIKSTRVGLRDLRCNVQLKMKDCL